MERGSSKTFVVCTVGSIFTMVITAPGFVARGSRMWRLASFRDEVGASVPARDITGIEFVFFLFQRFDRVVTGRKPFLGWYKEGRVRRLQRGGTSNRHGRA